MEDLQALDSVVFRPCVDREVTHSSSTTKLLYFSVLSVLNCSKKIDKKGNFFNSKLFQFEKLHIIMTKRKT